jgi:hypothetical protein
MVTALRWFLLSAAIINVLMATVLYRPVGRAFIYWYMSFFQFPAVLRRRLARDRVVQAWGLASAATCLALWWYLGTADGQAMLRAWTS